MLPDIRAATEADQPTIRRFVKEARLNPMSLNWPNFVIAEEVQSVTFRYFDGTAWQDSWDGTQASSGSGSPMGPPLAVEITLVVATPSLQSQTGDTSNLKTYRHVVAIPTANGTSSAPSSTAQQ